MNRARLIAENRRLSDLNDALLDGERALIHDLEEARADLQKARADLAAETARCESWMAFADVRCTLTCDSCPERQFHARSPESRAWLDERGQACGMGRVGTDLRDDLKREKRERQRKVREGWRS